MSILKQTNDAIVVYRFIRLLTMDLKKTEAYKMGIIDEDGKKLRDPETSDERAQYTRFIRLVLNIRKLIPGGRLGSFLAAVKLLSEESGMTAEQINEALFTTTNEIDFIIESRKSNVSNEPQTGFIRLTGAINEYGDDVYPTNSVVITDSTYFNGAYIYEGIALKQKGAIYFTEHNIK